MTLDYQMVWSVGELLVLAFVAFAAGAIVGVQGICWLKIWTDK